MAAAWRPTNFADAVYHAYGEADDGVSARNANISRHDTLYAKELSLLFELIAAPSYACASLIIIICYLPMNAQQVGPFASYIT